MLWLLKFQKLWFHYANGEYYANEKVKIDERLLYVESFAAEVLH